MVVHMLAAHSPVYLNLKIHFFLIGPVYRDRSEFTWCSKLLHKRHVNFKTCIYFMYAFISFQIRSSIRQVLEGISYLHQNDILHLDIKVSLLLCKLFSNPSCHCWWHFVVLVCGLLSELFFYCYCRYITFTCFIAKLIYRHNIITVLYRYKCFSTALSIMGATGICSWSPVFLFCLQPFVQIGSYYGFYCYTDWYIQIYIIVYIYIYIKFIFFFFFFFLILPTFDS